MFGSIGFPEIVLIFLVVILLFGPEKLPEFAKIFAKTIRSIKETVDEAKGTIKKELDDAEITHEVNQFAKELDPYQAETNPDDQPAK